MNVETWHFSRAEYIRYKPSVHIFAYQWESFPGKCFPIDNIFQCEYILRRDDEESENNTERGRTGFDQIDEAWRQAVARIGREVFPMGADGQPLQCPADIEWFGRTDFAIGNWAAHAVITRQCHEAG